MGANAQTTVPTFVQSQVLTAAQVNQINTGVPVFAGTTERDAAFGGTGEKTLAQGQLCYLESTNVVQYYNGSVWATLAPSAPVGLVFISQQTITTATSFSLPNSTFTSTYRSYRVVIDGACSSDSAAVTMRLRASGSDITASNYIGGLTAVDTTATARLDASNGTEFDLGTTLSVGFALSMDVYAPQVATTTRWTGTYVGRLTNTAGGAFGGVYNATTQADALSIILAGGQTFTGIVTTYGYANS